MSPPTRSLFCQWIILHQSIFNPTNLELDSSNHIYVVNIHPAEDAEELDKIKPAYFHLFKRRTG